MISPNPFKVICALAMFVSAYAAPGQGTFGNLGFESATFTRFLEIPMAGSNLLRRFLGGYDMSALSSNLPRCPIVCSLTLRESLLSARAGRADWGPAG